MRRSDCAFGSLFDEPDVMSTQRMAPLHTQPRRARFTARETLPVVRHACEVPPCADHHGTLPEDCPGWCEFSDPDPEVMQPCSEELTLAPGTVIQGPIRLVEEIGRGGMGVVFRGEHLTLRRPVAVKLMAPRWLASPAVRGRFLSEARALARMNSPHIVRIQSFGVERGVPFIVMSYVQGENLADRLDRPVAFREALRIIEAIARGVAAVHDAGALHNDIKAANVILGEHGEVTLVDFGLARPYAAGCRLQPGELSGTLAYLAPERIGGWADAPSPATDVYALGVLAFEILTGTVPFDDRDPEQILEQQLDHPAPRVSSRMAGVPPALDELIAGCLHQDTWARTPSASVFARRVSGIRAAVPPPVPTWASNAAG